MPAESGRSTRLDRCHDTPLDAAQMRTAIAPECVAVAAEHVRHL
jgi:hypothetical protein